MKLKLFLGTMILALLTIGTTNGQMHLRGVVYDVGLQFNPGSYSVDTLNLELVKYDMSVITNILRANAVRIEGEDIGRLKAATEIAHAAGLKVMFNPWMMGAGAKDVVKYMGKAARVAEELRLQGVELVFVAGCEFSLFNPGILPGNSINERIASMIPPAGCTDLAQHMAGLNKRLEKLNDVLKEISQTVRANYKGKVTYSSGTWETVDWSLFDIVGVDYYRDTQTAHQYVEGIRKYMKHGKPVIVMEVGSCTYAGAARRGGGGFTILQGTEPDGLTPIYEGGQTPIRSEEEQADYVQAQVELLNGTGVEGIFIYNFSFPIAPYRENGFDQDMTAYPIVKTYPSDHPRARMMPPWEPKEAFYRLADIYRRLEKIGE